MADDRGSPIHILIVDDNRITRENIARLLDFEEDLQVVGQAQDGREGVRMADELKPGVVLMDINMPDMDGIEACRQICLSSPRSRVMMMSVQGDMEYLRGAMSAGAREFLIKPFDYDELTHTIRKVFAADPSPVERAALAAQELAARAPGEAGAEPRLAHGTVVAVFGPKGGVGCSTIAVNLAVALSDRPGVNVLLVDGNLDFGGLGVMLDLRPTHRMVEVLERFDPDDPFLMEQMLAAHSSGVSLLASPGKPELAELVQPGSFVTLLESLRKAQDYIVLDMGSTWTELTEKVAELADRMIVVVTQEVTALKNGKLALDLPGIKDSSPEKLVLLLNKYSRAWGITPQAVSDFVGRPVASVIPADRPVAVHAANHGEPVLLSAPGSGMVRPLRQLGDLVPGRGQAPRERAPVVQPEVERPPSIISRRRPSPAPDRAEEKAAPRKRRGWRRWFSFLRRRRGD
jgi:pilus assembly protein CpaE